MPDLCRLAKEQGFETFRHSYRAAIKEVRTKIEILSEDFAVRHDYNPIHHMERRLKSPESIEEKLIRYGKEVSIESARENIMDIAGIRVVCNFIDDVYAIADMLMEQNDIRLITKKITYRILNPTATEAFIWFCRFLYFFWTDVKTYLLKSRYVLLLWISGQASSTSSDTKEKDLPPQTNFELKACAEASANLDMRMQRLFDEIHKMD